MKLAVSNLAWPIEHDEQILSQLAAWGVKGLEIAPAKIFADLENVSSAEISTYKAKVKNYGLELVAFQAFLFGRPELQLFDDAIRPQMLSFTKKVIDLGAALGIEVIVYGAPKSRNCLDKSYQECFRIARLFFKAIGDYAYDRGLCFCLEPNPKSYNCNFVYNAKQGAELVRAVDSAGFKLHLDVACMSLTGDDPELSINENADILRHFHVTEPNLGHLNQPKLAHGEAAQALKDINYQYWISNEMLGTDNFRQKLEKAIEFINKTYF